MRVMPERGRGRATARHRQHITFGKLADDAAHLGAICLRAACRFPQDHPGSGGAQLLYLRVNALAVGRYSCMAIGGHPSLQHGGWTAGAVAHPMNNELVLGRVIENQIGIRRSHHASQAALACKLAGMGMLQ
jgi:hypothetical protein